MSHLCVATNVLTSGNRNDCWRKNIPASKLPEQSDHVFANPFSIEDLLIFEQEQLCRVLHLARMTPEQLAWALHAAPPRLVQRVLSYIPEADRALFSCELARTLPEESIEQVRHVLLDKLFWELIYWLKPEEYEELTSGERLHPGIFQQLTPWLRDRIVLDAGCGSGRASFEAVRHGARQVYAVEPSPGLRHLLTQKLAVAPDAASICVRKGDFAHLPLPDQSVDVALSCSAFTSEPDQGGDAGLAELKRVTRNGGMIVLIWPRPQDRLWLAARHFHYVALPPLEDMALSFTNWQSAWRCVRLFYMHNKQALNYLLHACQPRLPFSVLGSHPPCDYCFLRNGTPL